MAHQTEGLAAEVVLPAPLTSIIGRERELAEIAALAGTTRLLTLVGTGGVGKTRLAIAAAAQLAHRFVDGVRFVDLARVVDPAGVIPAIAQVLNVRESEGGSLALSLSAFLHDQQLLLVLDNFEHLLEAAPAVVALLAACGQLHVLATSRSPLRVTGEQLYSVPPLELPASTTLADVVRSPAATLFVQRAQAVQPDFAITHETVADVAAICARLDGLPLALELAAARLRLLTPPALLARLTDRLSVLTYGARDLPVRQQTMRNTVQWSYDLLTPQAQRLFRALSVFAGGCTVEAAAAISGSTEAAAIDALTQLVDASLVLRDPAEGGTAELRIRLLETMRAFGLEQLRVRDEEEAAHQQHAAFFQALVPAAEPNLLGADQQRWLTRLDSELGNLRAALRWMLDHDHGEQALRLAADLSFFWVARGHWEEGRRWLSAALERAPGAAPALRLWAQCQRGTITVQQGDLPAARRYLEDSVALARELDHEPLLAMALGQLGYIAIVEGDPAAAEALELEALAIRRRLSMQGAARRALAGNLTMLGQALLGQGKADAAHAFLSESERLARELNSTFDLMQATFHLARVALRRRNLDGARERYEESLRLAQTIGSQRWTLLAQIGLAEVARDQGNGLAAASRLSDALATARTHGERWSVERWFRGALSLLLGTTDQLGLPASRETLRAALSQARASAFVHVTRLLAAVAASAPPIGALAAGDDFADTLAAARAALAEGVYESSWDAGPRLSVEELLRDALANDSNPAARAGGINAGGRRQGELTRREWEIAELVSAARSNAEIARALVLSERTVERHIENIYAKLGVHGPPARAALTAYVLQQRARTAR